MAQILVDEEYLNELIYRAEHDQLTGLFNRYGGNERMSKILRDHCPGYLIVIDIDSFKRINDAYSHAAGDKVLVAIAQCITKELRGDAVRVGGDEFGAYCKDSEQTQDIELSLNRMFERISCIIIPELNGEKLSVSVGAIHYNGEDDMTFEELYKAVDRLCYDSKKHEGNKATIKRD